MAVQTTKITRKTGGCYCGAVRFEISRAPLVKGQCHCRACQHMAGGAPQYFLLVPPDGFRWTQSTAAEYTRPDLEDAVTRSFCGRCGTQLVTRRPDNPAIVVKVGVLDDPRCGRQRTGRADPDRATPSGGGIEPRDEPSDRLERVLVG